MQTTFFVLFSLLMGAMLSIYLPMNSAVSRHLGSPITANITFFIVALLASFLIYGVWGDPATVKKIKDVPWWLYCTGIFSAVMILGTTFLIPKVGVRKFFILTISGQILTAIFVSHFGFLGTPKDPITLKKFLGAILVVFGAIFSVL
ncbi:MAG: DMT family transporter [Deferribacteres bacterium]|nr:DMT family transporter [candidate division KSB1 bacterium]MCB9501545.1 DMT family transporter [Deferribacteres bacterium]